MDKQSFALAPMNGAIVALTIVVILGGLAPLGAGLWFRSAVPLGAGAFVLALCLGTWLWMRPTRFEVSGEGLRLVWPLRRESFAPSALRGARVITGREFRDLAGFALRIGVGGLFGGFGLLWTSKRGMLRFYVSRFDGLLLVELASGSALLLSPERPEELARALEALPRAGSQPG